MTCAEKFPILSHMTFRQLRERAQVSRVALAKRLKLDYTTINKIELGKTPDPRYSTVVGLARVLKTTPEKVARAIVKTANARESWS